MYSEVFLYRFWYKLPLNTDISTNYHKIKIIRKGVFSPDIGPDFQDVQIELDGVLIRGDMEIHLRSSDWYYHGHHLDKLYDNVVLHLIWDQDRDEVLTRKKHPVPQISLRELIPFCAADPERRFDREELFLQRFSRKVAYCEELLKFHSPEDVLWILLARTLGYRKNSDTMELFARIYYPSRLRALLRSGEEAGDLFRYAAFREENAVSDRYASRLPRIVIPWRKGGRPANYPAGRVAYLAALLEKWWYADIGAAAEKILAERKGADYVLRSVEKLLLVRKREGRPGKERVLLFLVNWLLPLFYAIRNNDPGMQHYIFGLYEELPPEKIPSSRISGEETVRNAKDSQSFYEKREMDAGEHGHWLEELKIPYGI